MAFDRFLIGPITTGLQKDLPQWLLTEDAFPEIDNAYVWRGRIRKRFGSTYMSGSSGTNAVSDQFVTRLRIQVGIIDITGFFTGTLPAGPAGSYFVGQSFSVGSQMFTVVTAGGASPMLNTPGPAVGAFRTTDGEFTIGGSVSGTPIYFYPSLPVMGFQNFESGPIDNQPLYAWDTRFVYIYSGNPGAWSYAGTYTPGTPSTAVPQWHGTDSQFFWVTNYSNLVTSGTPTSNAVNPVMFVSNFNSTVGTNPLATDDPIWCYNPSATPPWFTYKPYFLPNGGAVATGPYVQTALIIVPWKNRLLLLNTIENSGNLPYSASTNTNFAQRLRFSAVASPFAVNTWYEPNQADASGNPAIGGSYIDAATEEQIIGCEFIKDQLVVYFERSTWLVRYTQNQEQPFVWERVNSELGSESTFSTVGFDKEILAIGNTGVHQCNGQNTARIDQKIPDDTFKIKRTDNGIDRVAGIRDFLPEMVYWSLPQLGGLWKWPNKVLVYNYRNASWAYNDDSITAFGYFEQAAGYTWSRSTFSWKVATFSWNSGTTQAQSRQVVAGNQEGFTFLIDAETTTNAPVMSITNMSNSSGTITVTAIDHNLQNGEWIGIYNVQGMVLSTDNYQVIVDPSNKDTFIIQDADATGVYTGGGVFKRVSRIDILSKQLNPYNAPGQSAGRDVYLGKVDFCVESTDSGQITIDYFPSGSTVSMVQGAVGTGAIMGNNILETTPYPSVTLEQYQDLLWHPVYFQSDGTTIQMRMYLTDEQMNDSNITDSDLVIQGMIWHTQPTTQQVI